MSCAEYARIVCEQLDSQALQYIFRDDSSSEPSHNQLFCDGSFSESVQSGSRTEIARGRCLPLAWHDRQSISFISAKENSLFSDSILEAVGTMSSSSLKSFGLEGEYKRSIGIASVADIVDIVSCSLTASVSHPLNAMHEYHCACATLSALSDTCDYATHARCCFGSSVKDVVL